MPRGLGISRGDNLQESCRFRGILLPTPRCLITSVQTHAVTDRLRTIINVVFSKASCARGTPDAPPNAKHQTETPWAWQILCVQVRRRVRCTIDSPKSEILVDGKTRKELGGFTAEQHILLGWAQASAANVGSECARGFANANEHPPLPCRGNSQISNG
jgi:hypothetical protein